MNLAPIADALVSLASTVTVACAPVLVFYFLKKVGLEKETSLRDSLTTSLQRGVGVALEQAQKAGDPMLQNANIRNTALKALAEYATENAGDAVAHFGLSNADIAQKAAAELALALHVPTPATPQPPASPPGPDPLAAMKSIPPSPAT